MPRYDAMLRGGRERLRPIMMTALTTLIGLVPMVVQKPSLGGVYYYSMALVIMGGLAACRRSSPRFCFRPPPRWSRIRPSSPGASVRAIGGRLKRVRVIPRPRRAMNSGK